jgi:peptidyl-prolyl cis-trans isomerase C
LRRFLLSNCMLRPFAPRSEKVRNFILFLSCLILANCAGSRQSQSGTSSGTRLPPVVATVDDHPIPTKLYEMYLKNGREELGLDPNTEEGRRKLEQLEEGIISELIDRTLIAGEAERRGLTLAPDKMAQAEQRTISQFGGEQKYDEYLKSHHLTRDEYREVIKLEVYGAALREELNKDISVTGDAIKSYYEAHKNDPDFQLAERVTASHILINARPNVISQQLQNEKHLTGDALQTAVKEEMERRRKTAEALRQKVMTGADFAALARESSEDPSSKEKGGDLGTFTRGTHTRAFDDAAFTIKPGTVGEVAQSDFGFHVIKVSKHEQARPMTLEEAAPEIRSRLLTEREAAKLGDWLKDARHKAKIHINEPFRVGALKTEFPPN